MRLPVIEVNQPLGTFYLTQCTALTLLRLTFSDPFRRERRQGSWLPFGTQRPEKDDRLREIAEFIRRSDAIFPASIVLAANYRQDGALEEDDDLRWRVDIDASSGQQTMIIPSASPLAAIVDGQHRLHAFEDNGSADMELPCSIFLDLPAPLQAYVFATINFNQKRVDKSLAYELFGISVEAEDPTAWTPEKLGVFLARKLNDDEAPESPFARRIKAVGIGAVPPPGGEWQVSLAVVVEGIMRLFSSSPAGDRNKIYSVKRARDRKRSDLPADDTPLRHLYLTTNDAVIYACVRNFFVAAHRTLDFGSVRSYLRRTVGIQALFDILRLVLIQYGAEKDFSEARFVSLLARASKIDFATDFFQASGKGRVRLRNAIGLTLGLVSDSDLPQHDLIGYKSVIGRKD